MTLLLFVAGFSVSEQHISAEHFSGFDQTEQHTAYWSSPSHSSNSTGDTELPEFPKEKETDELDTKDKDADGQSESSDLTVAITLVAHAYCSSAQPGSKFATHLPYYVLYEDYRI
ncbi:MAG: hypothetical protein AB8G22_22260 [Saprospiraceae bacterium]